MRNYYYYLLPRPAVDLTFLGGGLSDPWGLAALSPLGWCGPPPLCLAAGRPPPRETLACPEWGPPQFARLATVCLHRSPLYDRTPLHWASVVPRRMLLCAPTAPRVGSLALGLDMAPPAAVATSYIRAYLLGRLDIVHAPLQAHPASSDRSVCRLVRHREDHRRSRPLAQVAARISISSFSSYPSHTLYFFEPDAFNITSAAAYGVFSLCSHTRRVSCPMVGGSLNQGTQSRRDI